MDGIREKGRRPPSRVCFSTVCVTPISPHPKQEREAGSCLFLSADWLGLLFGHPVAVFLQGIHGEKYIRGGKRPREREKCSPLCETSPKSKFYTNSGQIKIDFQTERHAFLKFLNKC